MSISPNNNICVTVPVLDEREWDPDAANIYSKKHNKSKSRQNWSRHRQGSQTKLTTSTHRRTTPDKEHDRTFTQGMIGKQGTSGRNQRTNHQVITKLGPKQEKKHQTSGKQDRNHDNMHLMFTVLPLCRITKWVLHHFSGSLSGKWQSPAALILWELLNSLAHGSWDEKRGG